ncbi:MAG TPA: hypothetical protein VFT98_02570 [Myxococcota bacterium]|nr:hypothetical protein [Myxococcota bacterium]
MSRVTASTEARAEPAPHLALAPEPERAPTVGFLFNHDHVHQIAHSAPIAFELSRLAPDLSVTLLASTEEQHRVLEAMRALFSGERCSLRTLAPEGALAGLVPPGDFLGLRRVLVLRSNAELLRGFDALVVPEKTSLLLRNRAGAGPKLIHTRHGAGDRAIGFDAKSAAFDLVLLAGEKIRRRLAAEGALARRHAIVGYPKFDGVDITRPPRPLFANGKPTVLYNPHCSPRHSSWYRMGRAILDYFFAQSRFNLVFAPHVMMYRRRLQISLEDLSLAYARAIPEKFRACDHMRIDLGSPACTDMTYTLAADVYLGDVSSQVCEFLARPRPCLFANAHRVRWQGNPSYEAWKLGPVFERASELPEKLDEALRDHARVRAAQEAYVRDTFDLTLIPSSRRAAEAIQRFLHEEVARAKS